MRSFCMCISHTSDISLYSQTEDVVESAETNKHNKTNKQNQQQQQQQTNKKITHHFTPLPALFPVPNKPYGGGG